MPNRHLLKNWIALSVLFHWAGLVWASMIPPAPLRPPDVMVVDLADLPRTIDFPRPQPGIVEGAPPKPPAPAPPGPVGGGNPPPPRRLPSRLPPPRPSPSGRSLPPWERWSWRKRTPGRDGARGRHPETRWERGGKPSRKGRSPRSRGAGPTSPL